MQQAKIINMNHNRSTALERSAKITGGLKPVLRDPNLALSFYHGSKYSCSVRVISADIPDAKQLQTQIAPLKIP